MSENTSIECMDAPKKSTPRIGPRNNNWRGGRTLSSNGYMLIRFPGHPCADVRGYVYEHRLVLFGGVEKDSTKALS